MSKPHPHVIARAIAYEETGAEDWSELETSYGGGGFRINRERLAAHIAAAIEADRKGRGGIAKPPGKAVCPLCLLVFLNGGTCYRDGCPMGGDF